MIQGDLAGGLGIFGGEAGTDNEFTLQFPDGTSYTPGAKEIIRLPIPLGTIVQRYSGGLDHPHRRPQPRLARRLRRLAARPRLGQE